ncbi:SDR family NAD(P)-dependent oxidoreductase [Nitrospirillum sp. BR 11828]|uniref:SDR family NAD(P)-dependent oxidoreductase n=1 Tax=Nitrospirillum sp. BR 11828 TaxID=3104325 RepID=UPI002ACA7738|nr:SDR family NAD(P)-dependent oxidoreductase [Nitrospirillum sp. BR 11828]MDZ5645864.1 SDR family NAD(P)-dependent oxidoreductase [Nitrospirillum sp. BR 11828]
MPRRAMALADRGGPRRAGISAFGLSGVNVHAVVEAAPARVAAPATGRWMAVGLSAAEPEALRGYADALVAALRARPDWSLEEIARTLTEGRDTLPARLAVAVRDRGDLMARLAVFVAAPAAVGDLVLVGVVPPGPPGRRWAAVGPDQAAAQAAAQAFVTGAVLTWDATDGTTGRAHLPAAPLARRRLAPDLPAAMPVLSSAPDLLGPAAVTREGAYHPLDVHAPHFWPMAEHRLDGEPTLVGMAFPALVATARGPSRLRDLRWLRPLRASQVEPGTVTLRFHADGRVSLEGRARGGAWQTFAEARLDDAAQPTPPVSVAEIVARCAAPTAALPLSTNGPVVVSDRWQRLDRLAEGEGERLAWTSPATTPADAGGLALDPALLDVSTSLALDQAGLIPAGCAEIAIHGRLPSAPVVHVRWRAVPDGREADVVLADPADGRVAVAFHGLRFLRRAADAAIPPVSTGIVPSRPVWTRTPLTAPAHGRPVLVVGEGALADSLVRHLTTAGLLAGHCATGALDRAAVADILAAAPVDVVLAPDGGPDLIRRVTDVMRVVLGALVRRTRLLGVGFGAFAVNGQALGDPDQAITFGAVLCAGREETLLSSRYVDAGPATPAAAVLAEFAAPEAPFRAVAWREGERLVRGFAPLAGDVPDSAPDALAWPTEGVCVVTGGLGGLSLLLAPTLAAGGKVALALVSRQGRVTGTDPDAQARAAVVERLQVSGLRLSQHACDVTDRESLAATLDHIRQSVGPITAVVHNAGVSDGGFLVNTGHDVVCEMAAKVVGARLLDELTRNDPLRAFVMAGSLTGLLGAAGFTGYTAGNAFLDSFAAHLRAQGRPALTVDWCMIGEVGMAARTQHTRLRLEAHLGAATLPAAWRLALAAGEAQVVMLDPHAGPALRGEVPAVTSKPGSPGVPVGMAKADAPAEGGGALEAALAAVWAQVLGYDAVAQEDDFYSLGGDSIAGMQIVERVVRDLGHSVTLADLLEAGTVAALAARLRSKSRGTATPASTATMALEEPVLPLAPEVDDYPVAWEQLAVLNAEAVADMGTAYNLPMALHLPPG